MSEWWLELDASASFKRFLDLVESERDKKVRTLVSGRGKMGAPMTNDEYHGFAGEARALGDVLTMHKRARSQEPKDE